jgi:hypothetical protein
VAARPSTWWATTPDPGGPATAACPTSRSTNFDAALAELADRAVQILEVDDDQDDGYRLARLADPEGNELNVYALST